MTKRGQKDGRGRRAALRGGMLTAGVAAVVLGVVGGSTAAGAWAGVWDGEPYPVADPAVVAGHLDARTQSVYDALALPSGVTLASAPGAADGIRAWVYDVCRPRGLAHALERMSDRGADQPRTAVLGARFTLAGVTEDEWTQALGRARPALAAQGWAVGAAEDSGRGARWTPTPSATGPGALAESVAVAFDPVGGTLTVAATAECASYPDSTPVTWEGAPADLPTATAPKQLRAH
ncbi:hypothetical protein AB0O91_31430 [Kitasatospora sp. NPDC089797]|uniref:hypothetical protein n=1 Tax=Kitasatospora sp. NPDC089797 TaxID=3155298 RepID=UPI0034281AF4